MNVTLNKWKAAADRQRTKNLLAKHLPGIRRNLSAINEVLDASECLDSLLYALSGLGFILMGGIRPNSMVVLKILTDFRDTFSRITFLSPGFYSSVSRFLDFKDLSYEIAAFPSNVQKLPMPAPYNGKLFEEEEWEEDWCWIRTKGCEILYSALYAEAAAVGYKALYPLGSAQAPKGISTVMDNFQKDADSFIDGLLSITATFYMVDEIAGVILVDYPELPGRLKGFFVRLAQPRASRAKDYYFRSVISSERVQQISSTVTSVWNEKVDSSILRLFRACLAEEAIKNCIISAALDNDLTPIKSSLNSELHVVKGGYKQTCIDTTVTTPTLITIEGPLEIDEEDQDSSYVQEYLNVHAFLPRLICGNQKFSIHMLDERLKTGYAFSKSALLSVDDDFCEGAILFSYKKCSTGDYLVRFDNYISRKELKTIYNDSVKDIFFIGFDNPVYMRDNRYEFIKIAANAARQPVVPIIIIDKVAFRCETPDLSDNDFDAFKIRKIACDAWISQEREHILLRVVSSDSEPTYLSINGQSASFVKAGIDLYIAFLGDAESISESIEIAFLLSEETVSFKIQFKLER